MDKKNPDDPFWRFTDGLPSAPRYGDFVDVDRALRRLLSRDYDYSNKDIISKQEEIGTKTYQK